jgi:hypothetical protein
MSLPHISVIRGMGIEQVLAISNGGRWARGRSCRAQFPPSASPLLDHMWLKDRITEFDFGPDASMHVWAQPRTADQMYEVVARMTVLDVRDYTTPMSVIQSVYCRSAVVRSVDRLKEEMLDVWNRLFEHEVLERLRFRGVQVEAPH